MIAEVMILLGMIASPVVTERNLIPSIENKSDVCPDRPQEPDWMQKISLCDAFQRVLVQDIYRAQNIERIIETGSCACATPFPEWDTAEGVFQEKHLSTERWDMLQASKIYSRRANELRLAAKAISTPLPRPSSDLSRRQSAPFLCLGQRWS